jgi:hypothetical protein
MTEPSARLVHDVSHSSSGEAKLTVLPANTHVSGWPTATLIDAGSNDVATDPSAIETPPRTVRAGTGAATAARSGAARAASSREALSL